MKGRNQHKFDSIFNDAKASFTISFSLGTLCEKILHHASCLQIWALIITTFLSNESTLSIDSFISSLYNVSKVVTFQMISHEAIFKIMLILIFAFLTFFIFIFIIGLLQRYKYQAIDGYSQKLQSVVGIFHVKCLSFWVNLILINSLKLPLKPGYEILAYIFLGFNNFFGVICSIYCISPSFCKNEETSNNSLYSFCTHIFKVALSLMTFASPVKMTRVIFFGVCIIFYAIQLVVLKSHHPFYRFKTYKIAYHEIFFGISLSAGCLIYEILAQELTNFQKGNLFYLFFLIIPIVSKIAHHRTETTLIQAMEALYSGTMKRSIDAIRVISAVDYMLSIEDLNLEKKNQKLIYSLNIISQIECPETMKNSLTQNAMIHLNDHENLGLLKYIKISQILQNLRLDSEEYSTLRIILAEIQLTKLNDYNQCLFELEGVHEPSFSQYVLIRQLKKQALSKYKEQLSTGTCTLDIDKYVHFENTKDLLFSKIFASIKLQHEFLKKIYDCENKLSECLSITKKIEALKIEIETLNKKIDSGSQRSLEIIPFYSFYLGSVLNQPFSAEQEMSIYNRKVRNQLPNLNGAKKDWSIEENSNIVIKFSVSKSNAGKIIYVTENIKSIGWELRDLTGSFITKLLPEFLSINPKNFIENFIDLNNTKQFANKIHFIFLSSKKGYLIPVDIKLYLNPSTNEDLSYYAFCKPRNNALQYAIQEQDKILATSENLAQDINISSIFKTSVNISDLFATTLSSDFTNSTQQFKSTMLAKTSKAQNLLNEYHVIEDSFTLFSKNYKLLTLTKKSNEQDIEKISSGKAFLTKFHSSQQALSSHSDRSSSHLSDRICSEYSKKGDVEKIITTLITNNESSIQIEPAIMEAKENLINKDSKKSLADFQEAYQSKIPTDKAIFESRILEHEEKIQNYKVNPDESLQSTVYTNGYKKIQNSLLFMPPKSSSHFLTMTITLFYIISSIILITYYSFVKSEFDTLDNDLTTIYLTIKELQMVIELKKTADLYYMTDAGIVSPNRYAPIGLSLYHPVVWSYVYSNVISLQYAHNNLTLNLQENSEPALHNFYEKNIAIRDSLDSPISNYVNIPSFISRFISSNYILLSLNDKIEYTNPELAYIMSNSNDDILLNFEKIAADSYSKAKLHISDSFERIYINAGIILSIGVINLILLALREKRTRMKKRYFLNVLSLLDSKELQKSFIFLSDFLEEAKRNQPESLGLVWYERLAEEDTTKYNSKKENQSHLGNIKRLSQLKLPFLDLFKLISLMILLIVLLVLPFIILIFNLITSGDKDHLENLVGIQYKTGMSYYNLRLLIVSTSEYVLSNGTITLKNRAIGDVLTELSDDLSHFQTYLASIQDIFQSKDIRYYISGNICTTYIDGICETMGSGAGMRGLIGLNSFQLNSARKIKAEFDSSNRTFDDIKKGVNDPDGFTSEILDVFYNFALYDKLLLTEFDEIQSVVRRVHNHIIIIIIANFICNLVMGIIITRKLHNWMNEERNSWIKMVRRVPYKLAMKSKILNAFLNDPAKRDFE